MISLKTQCGTVTRQQDGANLHVNEKVSQYTSQGQHRVASDNTASIALEKPMLRSIHETYTWSIHEANICPGYVATDYWVVTLAHNEYKAQGEYWMNSHWKSFLSEMPS